MTQIKLEAGTIIDEQCAREMQSPKRKTDPAVEFDPRQALARGRRYDASHWLSSTEVSSLRAAKEQYHDLKLTHRNLDAAGGCGSFRFGLCRTAAVRPALVAEPQSIERDKPAVASDH